MQSRNKTPHWPFLPFPRQLGHDSPNSAPTSRRRLRRGYKNEKRAARAKYPYGLWTLLAAAISMAYRNWHSKTLRTYRKCILLQHLITLYKGNVSKLSTYA